MNYEYYLTKAKVLREFSDSFVSFLGHNVSIQTNSYHSHRSYDFVLFLFLGHYVSLCLILAVWLNDNSFERLPDFNVIYCLIPIKRNRSSYGKTLTKLTG
jgi:hypothetical protein